MTQSNGQLFQTDFADNTGGTNLADSVFKIKETQAAGGYNFDYILTGGVRKRLGPALLNSVADTQLKSLGLGLFAPSSGTSKSVIRAAGTKMQFFDPDVPSFTNLALDSSGGSTDIFTPGSTQTVNASQFNNGSSNILWMAGGGATLPVGATSTSVATVNGVNVATGSIGASVNAHDSGNWPAAGKYTYAVVLRKRSTQALSNAALDVLATTVNTDDTVTIDLTTITGLDTTLIDQVYIYRSAINGVSGFTTGSLIAQLTSTATSYKDTGTDIARAQNIPRSGNIVLDNSVLPDGTYNAMTVWKRRLVVATGSTLNFSDLNKSESWPATNPIQVPSAGNITGLAIISFTSPQAQSLDELLVVFKEREVWVVIGTDYTDWALKFIDQVGCPDQSLAVLANGFLAWIDFRGVYLWDGTSKPIYSSRLLEPLFTRDGDLDKTKLSIGTGEFFRRENQIIWYLSSKTFGEQKFALKMDLRLTLPQIEQQLTGRSIEAVFIQDNYAFPTYAALSYIPLGGAQEQLLVGDGSGKMYYASNGYADGASNYSFTYKTKALEMGNPNTNKQFHKVIAWVQDLGDWDLTLDYWSNYITDGTKKSTQALPISTQNSSATALWDLAYWDVAYWDQYNPDIVPLVYNLMPGPNNNTQGTALQIQFRNETANQPIIIHGFSVIWSGLGGVTG